MAKKISSLSQELVRVGLIGQRSSDGYGNRVFSGDRSCSHSVNPADVTTNLKASRGVAQASTMIEF